MTRRLTSAVCLLLGIAISLRAADLENLYDANQWFRLRDAVGPASPEFYRGAVAAAFNDQAAAERYLSAVMKSGADPIQRFEAGVLLEQVYARAGRRKAAASQLLRVDSLLLGLTQSSGLDPAVYRSFQQLRASRMALDGYPDQTVVARGLSRVPYFQIDNQIVVPLTINGQAANYYLDTGSSESFLSSAEAKRLGLTVLPSTLPVEPYGAHSDKTTTGVAVAHDLVIGNVHVRDVAFLVDQDEEHPGLLGLPLLLALGTLRWNSDGTLEFGFPSRPRDLATANLCLTGGRLVTEAGYGSEKLNLIVDSGAPVTLLFPTFTHQFAETAESATAEPFTISDTNFDPGARTLPTLTLRVGGADSTAGGIHALSRNFTESGAWAHGNLGTDFAGNAQSVTLDFQAMRMTIEGGATSAGNATGCPLPANFACLGGFTCTVRYDSDTQCHVDRIPAKRPAGNDLNQPQSEDPVKSCPLPAAFVCPRDEMCTAVFTLQGGCRIDRVRHAVAPPTATREPAGKSAVPAPTPAAGPDAREIVERSLKFESLELAPAKDYVYTDETVQKFLDADGAVKKTSTEVHEVMTLYDQEYERLVSKDGKPLPPNKEREEQARFDKAVEKRAHEAPGAKSKREETERKRSAQDLACGNEFLKLFQFHLEGAGEIGGRPAWIVQVNSLPAISPSCDDVKTLAKLHFRIWVDQAEFRWAQVQGDNIAPVTWGKVLLRIPTGQLHFTFQQRKLNDGVWMASSMNARVDPRLMVFAKLHLEVNETYSNYRKFQSDSRVVAVGEPK